MKSKSRCSAVLEGLKGVVAEKEFIGQVKPDVKKELSSRKVFMRHLPITLSFVKQAVNNNPKIGRPRIAAFRGDRLYLTGFTLIELLVVVLIIGILASIALPQYRKAVEKSRLTEARVIISTFQKAVNLYALTNGTQSATFLGPYAVELDIDIAADCSSNPQDPGDEGSCSTKYFLIDEARCEGGNCWIHLWNREGHYNLHWAQRDGKWGGWCQPNSPGGPGTSVSTMGIYICNILAKEGWDIAEAR